MVYQTKREKVVLKIREMLTKQEEWDYRQLVAIIKLQIGVSEKLVNDVLNDLKILRQLNVELGVVTR